MSLRLIHLLTHLQAVYIYGIAPCTGGLAFGYVSSLKVIIVLF
jgi:hypothetical protein